MPELMVMITQEREIGVSLIAKVLITQMMNMEFRFPTAIPGLT